MVLEENLVWTERLTMFNEKLDLQHKKLFNYINEIIEIEKLYPKSERFAEVLSNITDYGLEHFKTEERLMFDYGYPKQLFEKHRNEHKDYFYRVAMFNTNFREPKYTEPIVVINFLKDWWYKHIMQADMQFSAFIRKQLSS
jgi:hemerythrin-like metal-binding protein